MRESVLSSVWPPCHLLRLDCCLSVLLFFHLWLAPDPLGIHINEAGLYAQCIPCSLVCHWLSISEWSHTLGYCNSLSIRNKIHNGYAHWHNCLYTKDRRYIVSVQKANVMQKITPRLLWHLWRSTVKSVVLCKSFIMSPLCYDPKLFEMYNCTKPSDQIDLFVLITIECFHPLSAIQ